MPPYRVDLITLEKYGLSSEIIEKLQPLENKTYFSKEEFSKALKSQIDEQQLTDKERTLILEYSKLVPALNFDKVSKAWTIQNWVNYRGSFAVLENMKNVKTLEVRIAPSVDARRFRIEQPRSFDTRNISEEMLPVSIHGEIWWYLLNAEGSQGWIKDEVVVRQDQ